MANARFIAVNILKDLFIRRLSFTKTLPSYFNRLSDENEQAWIQDLCYGVARFFYRLDFIAKRLFERKSLKEKDLDIYLLILIGIYQLLYMRIPDHAAVDETVNVTRLFKKPWATNLVNAVLRNFLRNQEALLQSVELNASAKYAHPDWLLELVEKAWPHDWPSMVLANNQHPPLVLRVNTLKISRDAYFEKLKRNHLLAKSNPYCQNSIILEEPMNVNRLPGFQEGEVSIQDCSAQLAAELLDLKPHLRVLDACVSPGGKMTHILELEPHLKEIIGIDNNSARLLLVRENLRRLGIEEPSLIDGDVTKLSEWYDDESFDRILLDAPCSSTGVIRRHPEIKLLRSLFDISELAKTQLLMLTTLWETLAERGKLLYATCSILPNENEHVIEAFLKQTPSAQCVPIEADWGVEQPYGRQILTGQDNMDGFYYALLEKRSKLS